MKKAQVSFRLCANSTKRDNHSTELVKLIQTAEQLECVVAFANTNVWEDVRLPLIASLKKGCIARFTIGLSYFHTEPELLEWIFKLVQDYPDNLSLYMQSKVNGHVFHPKVYAARTKENGSNMLIGSANFTHGGLKRNSELSSHLTSVTATVFRSVSSYVDELIRKKVVVAASEALIAEYQSQHQWHRQLRVLAAKRAAAAAKVRDPDSKRALKIGQFEEALAAMRLEQDDREPKMTHFDAEIGRRQKHGPLAKKRLSAIASQKNITPASMLKDYDALVTSPHHLWHSGNLQRSKTQLARSCKEFRDALRMLDGLDLGAETAKSAYTKLDYALKDVVGAGINGMTEILHTYDPDKFPVMNQNSVAGILALYPGKFPPRPNRKTNVTPEMYADFANKCDSLRNELKLRNFAELDVLFNYIYWS